MSIQPQGEGKHTGEVIWCPTCGTRCVRWVDTAIWERADIRRALAEHDIATVYRLLQRFGVSQRRIAARTAQSQREISEILGGRKVGSYKVLVRIADGLGVPRGAMGLAHTGACEKPAASVGGGD